MNHNAPPCCSRHRLTWWLSYLLLGLIFSVLAGCESEQRALVLGYTAGEPNSGVAKAIAKVLATHQIAVTLDQPFESTEELTAAVEGGAVDFAILGEPLDPNPNLTMLMPILPRVLHVLHRKSLQRPTLHELLSAESIFAGQSNTLGRALINELALHHQILDLKGRLLDTPWVPSPGQPPQVYFIFGGLLSAEARLGFSDYDIFSFDAASDSSPETLALLYPNLRPFQLPAGIYPNLSNRPIETLAVETLLVARPDFNDELAYRVVQTLHEQSQPIESAYALSRESFSSPMAEVGHTLSMHSGARRFVNKDAPSLLERYAEVFALIATLAIGIGTALTTWLRQRRQRRKDRLDEFFLRLQRLRTQVIERSDTTDDHPPDERALADARDSVSALESEVLNLLVEERLAVDSALVSFFLMSDSVRRQLEDREARRH